LKADQGRVLISVLAPVIFNSVNKFRLIYLKTVQGLRLID